MSSLLLIAMAFLMGCGIGIEWPLPFWVAVVAGIALPLSLLLVWRHGLGFVATAMAAALLIGWGRPAVAPPVAPISRKEVCCRVVTGVIDDPPAKIGDEWRLAVAVDRASGCLNGPNIGPLERRKGRLLVTILDEAVPFRRGEAVRLRARVKPFLPRRNPGDVGGRNETPLFTAALSSSQMILREGNAPWSIRHPFDRFRATLSTAFQSALPQREAAMAGALSLGERRLMPTDLSERFRLTGVAHLLSVSGLHLGLTCLFAFGIFRIVLIRTPIAAARDVGAIAALLTIPVVLAFATLTGLRPPVVRAAVMAVAALLGRTLGRPAGTIEALALAAMIIVAADPETLLSPGFQLSFAAVLGFFVVFRARRRKRDAEQVPETESASRWAWVITWTKQLLVTTLSATAATAPLLVCHFGAVPLLGLLVNLIAVPLVGFVVMPVLLTAMALFPLSCAAFKGVAMVATPFLTFLDVALGFLSRLPLSVTHPGPILSAAVVIGSIAGLAAAAARYRPSLVLATLGAAVALLSLAFDPKPIPAGKMTVHFLDVGQGDSALLTTPGGRHVLIDTGGAFGERYDAGTDAVLPALRALGVRTLEALVLTHPDQDHAGGAPSVLRELEVNSIWENGHGAHLGVEGGYGAALRTAAAKRIPVVRTPGLCGTRALDGVVIEVIHPCGFEKGFDETLSTNDNSLVFTATFGRVTVLFMGDAGDIVEQRLIAHGRIGAGDILKLGHHGSRTATSSALLAAVRPGLGIASVGPFNRFGVPHEEVRARLASFGIPLLRTDVSGAVTVTTDGRVIAVERAAPKGKATPRREEGP